MYWHLLRVSRYSTKLRALSDAQVADFGAKLALDQYDASHLEVDLSNRESVSSSAGERSSVSNLHSYLDSPTASRASDASSDALGLGEFLKEAEAIGLRGRCSVGELDEAPETAATTPEKSASAFICRSACALTALDVSFQVLRPVPAPVPSSHI
jgi:LysM repeat protein